MLELKRETRLSNACLLSLMALLLMGPSSAVAQTADPEWQDTPESLRVDDSSRLCVFSDMKSKSEKAIRDERAYSKKYGVTDLGELNYIKHHIQSFDAILTAAQAGLRSRAQSKLSCASPLLVEFISCVTADSDEDFQAMQEDEKYRNCHARGFGIPAAPAVPQDVKPDNLDALSARMPPSTKELLKARAVLAKSGIAPESMTMAVVCASDISVMSRLPIASVVSDFSDIMALRLPASAVRRMGLPAGEAFAGLQYGDSSDESLIARLVDDRGFDPLSILNSVCASVASKQEDSDLGSVSIAAKGRSAPSQ